MHKLFTLVLLSALMASASARADGCTTYDRHAALGDAGGVIENQDVYCRCISSKVRNSGVLSNALKGHMFSDFSEDPFIAIGVDPVAARQGLLKLTPQQIAHVNELSSIFDSCFNENR